METLTFTVTPQQAAQRLDKFLCSVCPDLSRSYLQQLIADGHLLSNATPITNAAAKVKSGTVYTLHIPNVQPLALEPVAMALDIVFEDEHLLVINKQAGLTVHPAPGTHEATLVHGLLAHCGDSLSGIGGVARPGIVHRLDKDTSGLIIAAKTDVAHQHLSAQLKDRSLSRTYQAVCWGVPNPVNGTIDAPIGRHPKDRTRMAVVSRNGKEARTHYRTLQPLRITQRAAIVPLAAHIECQLETGRTHQIRVHLNHIGHGLIGDPLYGSKHDSKMKKLSLDSEPETMRIISGYRRQALHAARIRFKHPVTGESIELESALPADMQALLNSLNCLQKMI